MKKKLLYAVLSVSMVMSLMGCKNQNTNNTDTNIATDTDTNIATNTDTKDTAEEKADNTEDDKDKTKDTTTENTTETATEDTTEIKADATGESLGELEKKPENTTQTTKPNNNTQTKPNNTTQANTTENTTTQATTTEAPTTTEPTTEPTTTEATTETKKEPKMVWHEPVYETVTEEVPVYKDVEIMEKVYCSKCNTCGKLLYTQEEVSEHMNNRREDGSWCNSYRSHQYLQGTGKYKTVIWDYETVEKQVLVKEGYWEEVYE